MTDARITVDGVVYPLVLPDDMTLGEQHEFEKIADDGVDKIADLGKRWRSGIIVAWMAVSVKRAKPETPIDQIVTRLYEFKAAELKDAWQGIVGEQSPPAESSSPESNDSEPSSSEVSSSDSGSAQDMTPDDIGRPGSDSSAFAQMTSLT